MVRDGAAWGAQVVKQITSISIEPLGAPKRGIGSKISVLRPRSAHDPLVRPLLRSKGALVWEEHFISWCFFCFFLFFSRKGIAKTDVLWVALRVSKVVEHVVDGFKSMIGATYPT